MDRYSWRLAEATIANVLLHLGYLGWLALARAHGLELPNCGCFGVFFLQRLTPWMLLEDGILLAAAMALWFGARASSRKLGRAVPFAGRG